MTTQSKGILAAEHGLGPAAKKVAPVPPWLEQRLEPDRLSDELSDKAIDLALAEDVGSGDITSSSLIPADMSIVASVLYKQPAVVAGLNVLARVFRKVNERIQISIFLPEGSQTGSEHVVAAIVRGPADAILTGERTALNFLQRLSGIATLTRRFVELARPHNIAILDTRKTTPCLRALEKYAVRVGGGYNHRLGLFDQILIKDNHVCLGGGVAESVRRARLRFPNVRLEVETTSLEEVAEAVEARADQIMLDNMDPQLVSRSVKLINGRAIVEVSGGINLDNIREYLIPGVDAISVGGLTHSAPSVDISLEVEV